MGVLGLGFIWDTGDPDVLRGFPQDPKNKPGTESRLRKVLFLPNRY